ncbi:MAG: nitrous oxide-stimulated promoter family protein [Spirochaetales bacterium]
MIKGKELEVVSLMIEVYCRGNHGTEGGVLCGNCKALLEYVKERREKCPHGDLKPFCSNCRIHCYKSDMRAQIRSVMRYSGPRMMLYHPVIALKHLIQTKKQMKQIKKMKRDGERCD